MILMEIIFVFMLFIMGSVFGSFFTLAVYRIPLGLDITHERSFCPNCNHRLEFKDLIPIFSYLSLKGKCRYCGKPVRARYLVLEVLSGLVFVVAYFIFRLDFPFIKLENVINYIGFVFFYITNAITIGIYKEYHKINKKVLIFGVITNLIYTLYLYFTKKINLIIYVTFLIILIVLFLFDRKENKSSNALQLLMFMTFEFSYIFNLTNIF